MEKLCKGLNIPQKYNIFSLFEQCGTIEKNIEDRTVLADVLSKFEKLVLKSIKSPFNYIVIIYIVIAVAISAVLVNFV